MQQAASFDLGMSQPIELMGAWDKVSLFWKMRGLLRYFSGRFSKPVSSYATRLNDPALRRILENIFLPEAPVWFIMMLIGLISAGESALIDGGSPSFVQAIEARYRELGGEIYHHAPVKEILVENDRAVGVRLEDGSEARADLVISAADGHSTIFEMLGGRYVNDLIRSRYQNWKLFRPLLMLSFGVAREFPQEPHLSIMVLDKPFQAGKLSSSVMSLRFFNHSRVFAPAGKSVVQVTLETDWDFWHELRQRDPAEYQAEKQRVGEEVLHKLEGYFPGIGTQVEVTDIATPYTTWRYTHNYRGSYEGWLMVPETMFSSVVRTLPGLDNFYMAGQWVMPGGGVIPCLYSGRHLFQLICRQEGKQFVASQ